MEVRAWRCLQVSATEVLVQCLCGYWYPDFGHGHGNLPSGPCWGLLPVQQGRPAVSLCGTLPFKPSGFVKALLLKMCGVLVELCCAPSVSCNPDYIAAC